MNPNHFMECDKEQLSRFVDGDLSSEEKAQVENHLETCSHCRQQVETVEAVSKAFKKHVEQVAADTDFSALEKEVVNKALHQARYRDKGASFFTSLKFFVPAVATACLILFWGYTRFIAPPVVAPSAIINSFTGSMSSVMIFETPETKQTILWYHEDLDAESDSDAV
jgi:anti-sigma factor RsiW